MRKKKTKYNVGDIVKLKYHSNSLGVIIRKMTFAKGSLPNFQPTITVHWISPEFKEPVSYKLYDNPLVKIS